MTVFTIYADMRYSYLNLLCSLEDERTWTDNGEMVSSIFRIQHEDQETDFCIVGAPS